MQATKPITKRPPKKPSAGFAMALTVSCFENLHSRACVRGQGASFTRQELLAGTQGMWRTEIQSSDKVDSDVIEGGLTDIAAPVSVRLT